MNNEPNIQNRLEAKLDRLLILANRNAPGCSAEFTLKAIYRELADPQDFDLTTLSRSLDRAETQLRNGATELDFSPRRSTLQGIRDGLEQSKTRRNSDF